MYHALGGALGTLDESDTALALSGTQANGRQMEIMVISQHDQCHDKRMCSSSE